MKKATLELYRQKNSWVGYTFVPWLYQEKGINPDNEVFKWASENNAFVYKHTVVETNYPYDPPRYEYDKKTGFNHQLCDKCIEVIIYYYDKREVPDEVSEIQQLKRQLEEWEGQCNQN